MGQAKKIKCDCCGKETLAEIRDNKVIIIDKRHGRRHLVVLTLEEIIAIMQSLATTDGVAIVELAGGLSPAEG